jgi:hypothetical protein
MKPKLLEEPRGNGTVYRADGSTIDGVRYSLAIWQPYIRAGDQWLADTWDIRARVYVDLPGGDEQLTLRLQDGRWIDFQVSGNPDGEVVITGSLRDSR